MPSPSTTEVLELVDYRRRVAELYQQIRAASPGREPWKHWRRVRDELFRVHPQSPYHPSARATLAALPYFDHDPAWRTIGRLERSEAPETFTLQHSSDGTTAVTRVGLLRFVIAGSEHGLSAYWLDQYGGGLFVPFRDATSGTETYGGGRYLLDTAKGADLGSVGDGVVLDFNYAYHPSCVHAERWSCPLAMPEDRLSVAIRAGERSPVTAHG